ncbi:MAG TPA: hypothetical protein GXZ93_06625 [Actinobacteria bacterium]|nr:hypothetical protein [Actinomycetota bacterium]
MRKIKLSAIIIIILFVLSGTSFFVFKFISPINEEKNSNEKELTSELLGRIGSQKNFSDPLGIFDENGEELNRTDLTIIKSDGDITNVTRYEILQDVNGNDVKVKLKKQLIKEKNGKEYECWSIDEQVQGRIKYYLGKLKEVDEKEINFIVKKESVEMDLYTDKLVYEEVEDYEKIINLDEFRNNTYVYKFIPPNDIYIGFEIMKSVDDFKSYFNKKIYLQETILTYYENSPCSKQIFFSEYF